MDNQDVVSRLLLKKPFVTSVMDVDHYIKQHRVQQVTSPNIYEANSTSFHPDGIFSERIFGEIMSPERFITFGYIELNTEIIHPVIYWALTKKKKIYSDIINGTVYAIWDKEIYDFVKVSPNTDGADTGFTFFIKHLPELSKGSISSIRKRPIIDILKKFKDRLMVSRVLVLPAALREIKVDQGKLSKDDVNNAYMSLLNAAAGLEQYKPASDKIFDNARAILQNRAHTVFTNLMNTVQVLSSFQLLDRNIMFGTRNVASSDVVEVNSPDDEGNISIDDTKISLINFVKAFQPFVISYLIKYFSELFVDVNSSTLMIVNEAMEKVSVDISTATKHSLQSDKDLGDMINNLIDQKNRFKPVALTGTDGKQYYTDIVAEVEGEDILIIGRGKTDIESLRDSTSKDLKISNMYPLTWGELLYLICGMRLKDKHVFITRYPAIEDGSIYPSKVKIMTTEKSRSVEIIHGLSNITRVILPNYPVNDSVYIDSTSPHKSKAPGLGLDFDGDTISINGIWSDDTNKSIARYLDGPKSIIDGNMRLKYSLSSDPIVRLMLKYLTK